MAAVLTWTTFSACSKKPDPSLPAQKEDVETLFRKMVSKRGLTVKDPLYQKIIKMGPGIAPDLKRIAQNKDIQWHYIAYWMLGQIKDRDSIPFLMDALNSDDKMIRLHAVRGLNCSLRKGMYNPGADDAEEIELRYKKWWEKHKSEFLEPSKSQ